MYSLARRAGAVQGKQPAYLQQTLLDWDMALSKCTRLSKLIPFVLTLRDAATRRLQ